MAFNVEGNNKMSEKTTLKQIFETYAEESVDDEQVRRVLEPIKKMVNEGRFDRSKEIIFLGKTLNAEHAQMSSKSK